MQRIGFEDRVVVVTGGGRGLGRAYCEDLAARGARVVVNDLGGSATGEGADASAARDVVEAIRSAGGEATANTDSVAEGARIVECAMDTYGRLDAVINNAGILRDQAFHRMDLADWDAVFEVHVRGVYKVTRAAWAVMRQAGYGRILLTASGAGVYGNFGQANYAAAKLSMFGLAQTLAIEGAGKDILVNAIAPVAASRLTAGVMPPELLRVLQPDRVAPLAVYLVSEGCGASGQIFEVGGGVIARLRWERSRGATFASSAAFSAEDVAAAWPQVQAFEGGDHPQTVADSFAPISRNTGVELRLTRQ